MIYLRRILSFCMVLYVVNIQAQESGNDKFYFIAFGDMPYFLPQDYAKFERVIQMINDQKPSFTVNVGDFKSSSTPCSDEAFNRIYNYYNRFEQPMIYVPGDNEWTDCSKKEAGSYLPEERLEAIRSLFFSDTLSFGIKKLRLTSQRKMTGYTKFVENNRWDYGNISFATLHVVGSNNNLLSTSGNGNSEFYERQKADIVWMEDVFKHAKMNAQKGIVLIIHADMFSEDEEIREGSGFYLIKKRLQELVVDFKKPVLLINGDSHKLLIDKPFYHEKQPFKSIDSFTRLQVTGEYNMNAVKISVDPDSPTIFQFEELIPE